MDDLFIVALGSCTSLIFVWNFLLLLVLCPSGTHEILGTKETDNIKECLTTLGWTIFSQQQVSQKPMQTEYK